MEMKRKESPKRQFCFHSDLMFKLAANEFPTPRKSIVQDRSWLNWKPQASLSTVSS